MSGNHHLLLKLYSLHHLLTIRHSLHASQQGSVLPSSKGCFGLHTNYVFHECPSLMMSEVVQLRLFPPWTVVTLTLTCNPNPNQEFLEPVPGDLGRPGGIGGFVLVVMCCDVL